MKNKILKLCKRINKATVDEISPILCLTEAEIQPVMDGLVSEGLLNKRSDGIYFYIESESTKPKLPLFFEFRTKQELDLLIKCFCAGLPAIKTEVITGLSEYQILSFNSYIRQRLYEIQFEELKDLYNQKPYTPRVRKLLNKTVYFYYYDKTYVSESKLKTDKKEEFLSKNQDLKFRVDYLKLSRRITHNKMQKNITYYVAEHLLRMDNLNGFIEIETIEKLI